MLVYVLPNTIAPPIKLSYHRSELFLHILLQILVQLSPVLCPVDLLDVVQDVRLSPGQQTNDVVDSANKSSN